MPAPKDNPGDWGTDRHPLVMSSVGWEYAHPFLAARMQHVHVYHGGTNTFRCVKNRFGWHCNDGEEWSA